MIAYATPFTQNWLISRGVTLLVWVDPGHRKRRLAPFRFGGWGINQSDTQLGGQVSTSQSWTLGMEWNDLCASGNNAGMLASLFRDGSACWRHPADGQFIWEWWYQLQVTDNISVTPALFYLSRPMGDFTPDESTFRQLGSPIKTAPLSLASAPENLRAERRRFSGARWPR